MAMAPMISGYTSAPVRRYRDAYGQEATAREMKDGNWDVWATTTDGRRMTTIQQTQGQVRSWLDTVGYGWTEV